MFYKQDRIGGLLTRAGGSIKPRFSASPHMRKKNKDKGGGRSGGGRGGPEHPHAKTIREAYSTVVLEASELGAAGAKSKEAMLKEAASLASNWTKSRIGIEDVRKVVG